MKCRKDAVLPQPSSPAPLPLSLLKMTAYVYNIQVNRQAIFLMFMRDRKELIPLG